ncbi:FliH/SctL family protein [Guyparkeria halophila]|uniref:Flagellar assembly protein FliH n=1 Tax=Guyparkeria halophila TaxID=47960 RepID=A0ABZ0YX55_9GAMM|nr:FliH/SctL family protein [Guyparkeria halophila]WQH15979.1 FliH/SctL family protein [Guyparkeria halophila]
MSSSDESPTLTRPLDASDWSELVGAWELPDFSAAPADEPAYELDPATAEELAEARAEAEQRGYEAGLQKGRDAGYQEGMAAAREEIESVENRLRGWLSHLERPLALLDDEVTEQLTALATQIARVMVAREVQADNSGLPSIAREALAALPVSARAVILRCAPADETALRELIDDSRFETLDLKPDPTVTAGGVVVESGDARVDASLANRWAATLDHLIGRVYPGPDQPVPDDAAARSGTDRSDRGDQLAGQAREAGESDAAVDAEASARTDAKPAPEADDPQSEEHRDD